MLQEIRTNEETLAELRLTTVRARLSWFDRLYMAALATLTIGLLAILIWSFLRTTPPVLTFAQPAIAIGALCPDDAVEFRQPYVSNTATDLLAHRVIRRAEDASNFAPIGPAIPLSVDEGEAGTLVAHWALPEEGYNGETWTAGDYYVYVSASEPGSRARPARFRVAFTVPATCFEEGV